MEPNYSIIYSWGIYNGPSFQEDDFKHSRFLIVSDGSYREYGLGEWEKARKKMIERGYLRPGTQTLSKRLSEPPRGPSPSGVLDALLEEREEGL